MSVLRQSDLLDRWAHAFCEDTMLYGVLRRLGYRVAFVPSLMMVNREGCSLPGFCRWVRRQLLTVRLYHPAWSMIVWHGVAVAATQLMGIASLGTALGMGRGLPAAWLAAGMVLYWGTMAALLVALEAGIRHVLAARGEPTSQPKTSEFPRVIAAMLLTQAVYPVMLLSALVLRTVDWRGIRYRVEGPEEIHMVEYRPYAEGRKSERALRSL
jgi:hypothetical protein